MYNPCSIGQLYPKKQRFQCFKHHSDLFSTYTGTNPDVDALLEENDKLRQERTSLYQELGRLQTLCDKQQSNQKSNFGVDYLKSLQDCDKMFLFYTGVSSVEQFEWLVGLVHDHVIPQQGITIPNQLLVNETEIKFMSPRLSCQV